MGGPDNRADLDASCIGAEAIERASDAAARTGRHVTAELADALEMDSRDLVPVIGRALGYPVLPGEELAACTALLDRLSLTEGLQREAVAVRTPDGEERAVIADPFDRGRIAWLDERLRGMPVCLTHPADLAAYLARFEGETRAVDSLARGVLDASAGAAPVESLSLATISESSSVVVRLVNSTLYDAYRMHASDVHLETNASGLVIKYRIDGVLSEAGAMAGMEIAEQAISRVKVMAELDISERRVPQDGRFKVAIGGRQIDFRVSVMPSIFGEDAVLRILDKQELADQLRGVSLENLGFDALTIRMLRRLSAEPHGMLLVTGPTGSGKTTTLYAMISEINRGRDKIITIEDPVEYQLPGVLQIPVNEKKGLTFARGLRSILRHDPDKIMIGEIRDGETAQIAVQSALTGHLVFTTIHANNVFDVIGRFMQLGVDPYSFVSALNAVVAQRLLRLACPRCTVGTAEGTGCPHCRGTGYRGRTAIAEMLILDDEVRQIIVERQPIRVLKEAAKQKGTRLLRASALELARQGKTTMEEVDRVTSVA